MMYPLSYMDFVWLFRVFPF